MNKSGNISGDSMSFGSGDVSTYCLENMPNPNRSDIERPDLSKLIIYWRDRLSLRDWSIRHRYCDWKDLSSGENDSYVLGRVTMTATSRGVFLSIADPKTFPDDVLWMLNVRRTVAHEMLHLSVEMFFTIGGLSHAELVAVENHVHGVSVALHELRCKELGIVGDGLKEGVDRGHK